VPNKPPSVIIVFVQFWFAFVAQHILKGRQHGKRDNTMSGKKKNNPLPASSAGLLRFFEDETEGVKIKPEIVLATSMGLVATSIAINLLFPAPPNTAATVTAVIGLLFG
jgi:preprotein translocase subunit Sec61beta